MSSLLQRFADSVERHAENTALQLYGRRWTYERFGAEAGRIAGAVAEAGMSQDRMVGLLARDSLTAYAGIPAILAAGRGFVPVDPTDPPARIRQLVTDSVVDTLVVGVEALDRLEHVLGSVGRPMAVIAPEAGPLKGMASRHPRHRYVTSRDLPPPCRPLPADVPPDATAYMVYPSGTPGLGPRVEVTHDRISSHLEVMDRQLPVGPADRCGHHLAPTCDAAIHDMFTTWSNGACLVVRPSGRDSSPAQFIRDNRLTRWSTVPAVAASMNEAGQLSPGRFATLRDTLFFGGPLSVSLARRWARAAPGSSIVNLYGPAETTVAATIHRFEPRRSPEATPGQLVPLGRPIEGHDVRVVADDGRGVEDGTRGELWISGPRVAEGYSVDDEATDRRFVGPTDGTDGRWFRTGDLVERDAAGRLHLKGRIDDRVRLMGRRVQLSDVERVLSSACGHPAVRAVGWPVDEPTVYGLVGLVATDEPLDVEGLVARCRRHLPAPMVPDRLVGVDELPTDEWGRLDTTSIHHLLERQEVCS